MKTPFAIVLISIFFLCCSCAGVKFTPVKSNLDMPDAYKQRSIYPGGVAAYTPTDLAGTILTVRDGQQPRQSGKLYPLGFTPEYKPLTSDQSLNYYFSRITRGAEAQGSYLSFAASFDVDEMAELEMVDIGYVNISLNAGQFEEIKTLAKKWVEGNPRQNAEKRVWIKTVVLTGRTFTSASNITANATVATGAVKVGTNVYSTNNTKIKSVLLAFEAFDVDELANSDIKLAANVEPEISLKSFKTPFRVLTVVGDRDNPAVGSPSNY